jgi:hypothetical protein
VANGETVEVTDGRMADATRALGVETASPS